MVGKSAAAAVNYHSNDPKNCMKYATATKISEEKNFKNKQQYKQHISAGYKQYMY